MCWIAVLSVIPAFTVNVLFAPGLIAFEAVQENYVVGSLVVFRLRDRYLFNANFTRQKIILVLRGVCIHISPPESAITDIEALFISWGRAGINSVNMG